MARLVIALALLATAAAIGGCALAPAPSRPAVAPAGRQVESAAAPAPAEAPASAAASAPAAAAARVATANRTHESPAPAAHETVPGGWRSPLQAVQVFADTYINWSAATVSSRLRLLAAVSIDQARSAMALAAAQTAGDVELHRGGIGNAGAVESVAPLPGAAGRYVVVTREQTTAANTTAYAGLQPSWHVAVATVARVTDGLWVVSAWQPES